MKTRLDQYLVQHGLIQSRERAKAMIPVLVPLLVSSLRRAEELGAGEIVVNSVDADGTRAGFELTITRLIADAVGVPVVASGGAGCPGHLRDAFVEGHADAAIVAGMLHTGDYTIASIKRALAEQGVPVRRTDLLP